MSATGMTAAPGPANTALVEERMKLEASARAGADWFFWIAGALAD